MDMPEIWVKYGNTHVALDIKLENLQAEILPKIQGISEDEILNGLQSLPLSNETLVLTLSESRAVNKVASLLSQATGSKGCGGAEVSTLNKATTYDPKNGFNIGSADSPLLLSKPYKDVVFVSRVSYDPLFGFSGSPTLLLRHYMHNQMLKAYELRKNDIPTPGVNCPPLEEALSSTANLSAFSVEIVESDSCICGIFPGKIGDAFRKAVHALSSTQIAVERTQALILGGTAETDVDLSTSLNLIWNSAHVLQEGGSAAILAQNRNGLGKGALQMLVEGKLKVEDLERRGFYIEGLEHLLYLKSLREKFRLGVVSTLPCWYLSKLGLEAFRGSTELLKRLLTRYGNKSKILVSLVGDTHLLKMNQ